jgi:hypothetical protein
VSFLDPHGSRFAGVSIAGGKVRFPGARGAKIQTTLLGATCVCVLVGILVAGLWPFHAPRNDVSWSSPGNGLLFGRHGSVVSAGSFAADGSHPESGCSIEIWVQPSRADSSGTIFAVYVPANPVVPFALRQSLGFLKLEHEDQSQSGANAKVYVKDVFSRPKLVFVTISSGEAGTAIYVDGALVKKAPDFRLTREDLTGQFMVGNAPSTNNSWPGLVKALAVYDRELPAAEVSQHFVDWTAGWTKSKRPNLAGSVAIYLFNEGVGNVVQNQIDSATNLVIPERFFVLRPQFLERPWDEFRRGWNYWKDVAINIAGFIPLGFCFSAYFSAIGGIKRATWLTIALGFSVSLTIEVLQAFLPTRDSGMTDLITNTSGTALGVILYAWASEHRWFAQADIPSVLPFEKEERIFIK